MPLTLEIPDEILDSIKIPKGKAKEELLKELAIVLYEKEIASMGVVRKLSKLTKWEFIDELAKRGIKRHYYDEELMEDLKYAKGDK